MIGQKILCLNTDQASPNEVREKDEQNYSFDCGVGEPMCLLERCTGEESRDDLKLSQ